jgi:hypothetical protein
MSTPSDYEDGLFLEPRNPHPRPGPLPDTRLGVLFNPDINAIGKRQASSAATSTAAAPSTSCGPNDNSPICQKPVDATSNTTLPIVLGVVIPLLVAFVLFAVLHRRHVKKLRKEDANDRLKSLDFGMEGVVVQPGKKGKTKKAAAEMQMADSKETIRRGRGLSLDISEGNPYLLPPGLHQSRESIHSLSRAMISDDDRYARATSFVPNDGRSTPSSLRKGLDDSSSFTGSSRRTPMGDTDSSRHLIRHAHRHSRSMPPTRPASIRSRAASPQDPSHVQTQSGGRNQPAAASKSNLLVPSIQDQNRDSYMSDASVGANAALRASNNYLAAFIRGGFLSSDEKKEVEEKKEKKEEKTQPNLPEQPAPVSKSPIETVREAPARPAPSFQESRQPPAPRTETPPATAFAGLPSRVKLSQTQQNDRPIEPASTRGMDSSSQPQSNLRPSSQPEDEVSNHYDHTDDIEPAPTLRHAFTLPEINIGEHSDVSQQPTHPSVDHSQDRHQQDYPQQDYHQQDYPQQDYHQQDYPQQDYPQQDYPQQDHHQQDHHQQDYHQQDYQQQDYHQHDQHQQDCYQQDYQQHGHHQQGNHQEDEYYDEQDWYYEEDEYMYDSRRSTMGVRPLPPDDPSENPEERAIRIRSFYKEYFEESKSGSKQPPLPQHYDDGYEDYPGSNHDYEQGYDYGYEQNAGDYYQPRRVSQFSDSHHNYRSPSGSSFVPPRPKAYSSASGRYHPGMRGPPRVKKRLPPPGPLQVLPTPHKLKDDNVLPIDFAPPSSYRERRAGTPDNLRGGLRPYSPSVPAHLPLASSFDELPVMPSP